ncbi:hypothetical protein K3N28_09200 [Glycomyces sp. TRM65418]|uniref:hypothetical protein n=1 Tax=Glycomyces sp. TRM65418 TaxID=2867006 RepID=UPI001CE67E2F|nr:hypothetical protein [Glycomyces sp. TRM65418]MCC3763246.1 hypothetical protein [Glycomyces sp. TRM65418]QZD57247.1 hypothetical protein K3N28_09140 [Glycomyces sp. TRM65418]
MSWAPVLVRGDRRVYVGPGGDVVELPQEAERFTTREDALQRAIEARDEEQARGGHGEAAVDVEAEEVE